MKITALYKDGELTTEAEKTALRELEEAGWPADYVNFLWRYSSGCFAETIRIKRVQDIQLQHDRSTWEVEIGLLDFGRVSLKRKNASFEFCFQPRDEERSAIVFNDFHGLMAWAQLESGMKMPMYIQQGCKFYQFPTPLRAKSNKSISSKLKSALMADDSIEFKWRDCLFLVSESKGVIVTLQMGAELFFHYRLNATIDRLIEAVLPFTDGGNHPSVPNAALSDSGGL